MGRDTFVKTYGSRLGSEAQAETIYAKARHISAMALAIFGKYGEAFHTTAVTPKSMAKWATKNGTKADGQIEDAVKKLNDEIPNWVTLFGPPVSCECVHCRSVYSPAAYLVDTLNFLEDNAGAALTELLRRRPDIANIELSCENTNTPVPYVDLVNEVLENAVAPTAFSLASSFQSELDAGNISSALREAFGTHGALLTDQAAVAVEKPGNRWAISDPGWRYHIESVPGELQVSAAAQTKERRKNWAPTPSSSTRRRTVRYASPSRSSHGIYPSTCGPRRPGFIWITWGCLVTG